MMKEETVKRLLSAIEYDDNGFTTNAKVFTPKKKWESVRLMNDEVLADIQLGAHFKAKVKK